MLPILVLAILVLPASTVIAAITSEDDQNKRLATDFTESRQELGSLNGGLEHVSSQLGTFDSNAGTWDRQSEIDNIKKDMLAMKEQYKNMDASCRAQSHEMNQMKIDFQTMQKQVTGLLTSTRRHNETLADIQSTINATSEHFKELEEADRLIQSEVDEAVEKVDELKEHQENMMEDFQADIKQLNQSSTEWREDYNETVQEQISSMSDKTSSNLNAVNSLKKAINNQNSKNSDQHKTLNATISSNLNAMNSLKRAFNNHVSEHSDQHDKINDKTSSNMNAVNSLKTAFNNHVSENSDQHDNMNAKTSSNLNEVNSMKTAFNNHMFENANQHKIMTDSFKSTINKLNESVQAIPPRYYPEGPQQNVPMSTVLTGGWRQCHIATYKENTGYQFDLIRDSKCTGPYVMLGCRRKSSNTITLLAAAPRNDVFNKTDTYYGQNKGHVSNGSKWYLVILTGKYKWSWGFADQNDQLNFYYCDYNDNEADRLCWYLHSSSGGWRCGATTNLNGSNQWEKLIFTKY